jgi:hypothetical protein
MSMGCNGVLFRCFAHRNQKLVIVVRNWVMTVDNKYSRRMTVQNLFVVASEPFFVCDIGQCAKDSVVCVLS